MGRVGQLSDAGVPMSMSGTKRSGTDPRRGDPSGMTIEALEGRRPSGAGSIGMSDELKAE